jgi:hypothetical protein
MFIQKTVWISHPRKYFRNQGRQKGKPVAIRYRIDSQMEARRNLSVYSKMDLRDEGGYIRYEREERERCGLQRGEKSRDRSRE